MTTHITKTWFDGQKVVTQEIPESEVYKPVHMTDRELMQQALSVLCNNVYPRDGVRDNRHLTPKSHAAIYQQTVDALFERLAQPEEKNT